ncbi:hypothetical protein EGW08_001019 [Elysia chlorotica]|uniref:EGF-like domain-containing protein n=1 Tax=Elysia chlorotica TaxID=188477 RepID=A0A3S1BTW1_ELYCH|nr:hypothetical protein EGW08_001019 [Elysia chlorotica]
MQCTLTAAVAVSLNGPLRLLAALLLVAFLAGHVMWLAITQQVDGPEQFTERHKGSQGPSLTPSTKELSSNPYDQERSIDNWMATSLHNTADGQPKPRQTSVLFYDPHRKSREISNHRSLGSFSGEPWSKPKVAELITEPFRDVTSLLERHGRQAGDSSATTTGGDFQCDTVGMLSNNLAICFRDGNIFSRKCVPCGRNQYWTGTWCEVEQVRLDCRPCPGVTYINHTSHYLKKCEEPGPPSKPDKSDCTLGIHACQDDCTVMADTYVCLCRNGRRLNEDAATCYDKSDCTLGIHACQDDCTVMADTYVCLCRNGRRLNEDAATCYDALELNIQVEAVYTPPGDDQVSEGEIKRQLVLSIVQKLPKVTEAGENDFHQSDESLSAWVSVVVNGSAGGHYQTAAVTAALISLSGQESTTEDGHTFRYLELKVNGLPGRAWSWSLGETLD